MAYLPNQVEPSDVFVIKVKTAANNNLTGEETVDSNEHGLKDDKDRKVKLLLNIIWRLFGFLLNFVAGYWIYQVLTTYISEPVMSSTAILRSKSFTWPSIAIATGCHCFNRTAVHELSHQYNLSAENDLACGYIPFNLEKSNFNWSRNNLSNILLQAKYTNLESIFPRCTYRMQGRTNLDCMNASSGLGKWESYNALLTPIFDFTPISTYNIQDKIFMTVSFPGCNYSIIAMHPSTDRYSSPIATAKRYLVRPGDRWKFTLAVQEFERVSTTSSPCAEDIDYSLSACIENKKLEYLLKKAGCYVPGITGVPVNGNYQECNNLSSYQEFFYWHIHITHQWVYRIDELEEEKSKCLDPCSVKLYQVIYEKTFAKDYGYSDNYTYLQFRLDGSAMYSLKVKETFAMTVDMLVANIGGTLGLFLGFSCFTLINALQSGIIKISHLCKN